MDPHLQVTSDPAHQVGRRPLPAAVGGGGFVSAYVQQQRLVEHHLPQLRRKLCDELQAGGEQLAGRAEVLQGYRTGSSKLTDYILGNPGCLGLNLYGDAVQSFGRQDVDQISGQAVFDGQDGADVIRRDLPLRTDSSRLVQSFMVTVSNQAGGRGGRPFR